MLWIDGAPLGAFSGTHAAFGNPKIPLRNFKVLRREKQTHAANFFYFSRPTHRCLRHPPPSPPPPESPGYNDVNPDSDRLLPDPRRQETASSVSVHESELLFVQSARGGDGTVFIHNAS